MTANHQTIGHGADTKVLVPIAEWNSIMEERKRLLTRMRTLEAFEGFKQGYQEALEMEKAGVKGLPREEFMRQLRAELEAEDGDEE